MPLSALQHRQEPFRQRLSDLFEMSRSRKSHGFFDGWFDVQKVACDITLEYEVQLSRETSITVLHQGLTAMDSMVQKANLEVLRIEFNMKGLVKLVDRLDDSVEREPALPLPSQKISCGNASFGVVALDKEEAWTRLSDERTKEGSSLRTWVTTFPEAMWEENEVRNANGRERDVHAKSSERSQNGGYLTNSGIGKDQDIDNDGNKHCRHETGALKRNCDEAKVRLETLVINFLENAYEDKVWSKGVTF